MQARTGHVGDINTASTFAAVPALCHGDSGNTRLRVRRKRGAGSRGGVRGVWASDFDADGRCQAFCFPVKGAREIPALKCSLEERHQHLLGKQMERAGSGVRRPRAARREAAGGGGRKAGVGVSPSCCSGMEDLLPLALYQRMGSLLDPKSHQCESGGCPLGSPR